MNNMSKQIKEICRVSNNKLTPKQVIDDLVQLGLNVIGNKDFNKTVFRNTLYGFSAEMRPRLAHYKNDLEAWELLQELFNTYLVAIHQAEPFADVIGSMYDEYLGDFLGQYLTPHDVSDLLMELIMTQLEPITKPFVLADDMGCGAGSLILAQLRAVLKSQGKGALKWVHAKAVDIDISMVQMCTVQVVLSSAIHRLPIGSFTSFHANILTANPNQMGQYKSFAWIPDASTKLIEVANQHQGELKRKQVLKEDEHSTELQPA